VGKVANGITTVHLLLKDARRWGVRSAGQGSKGQWWYASALLATASPRHYLLAARHRSNA
jgi:hypothetical protein